VTLTPDTARLLDDLDQLLTRFVAFPSDHARHAVAAWVLHTWSLDAFDSTPRLALLSPEKGSGKTRTLEVLEQVVPGARHTFNSSVAVLVRRLAQGRTTLLIDEADTVLGWKVAAQHEDLRGLVNAGHRRGAVYERCSTEKGVELQEFPAFAAVALAGIGDLPDTILDRSIIVSMKRRAPSEQVEPFRPRKVEPEVAHLVDALNGWAVGATPALEALVDSIELPDGIEDRPADVWEPLVAVGDLAGAPWSGRLRTAAVVLNGQRAERDPSLGVQLLRDVRDTFDRLDVDRMTSVQLVEELTDLEGAPWSNIRGEPIDANGLARRLKPYEVRPASHRFGDHTARGYLRTDFYDAWSRYLPPPSGPRDTRDTRNNVTPVTPVTSPQGGSRGCVECGEAAETFPQDGTAWCGSCFPGWESYGGAA
jgi:hypothetical protein